MAKKKTESTTNAQKSQQGSTCSVCGQLYNNFVFKGGYICEDCLDSIKVLASDRKKKER